MQSCHVCHRQIACNEEESIYGYTIGMIFSEAYSCFRPEAAIRKIRKPSPQGGWHEIEVAQGCYSLQYQNLVRNLYEPNEKLRKSVTQYM